MSEYSNGLSTWAKFIKRLFDVAGASIGLLCFFWLICIVYILAAYDTGKSGFFRQLRVGKGGRLFRIIKIRTMKEVAGVTTTVTTGKDVRITKLGRFWRKAKLDELPQLWNVLVGDMSFVGPRPDVPGFADKLTGEDRIILSIRPGITGPATLAFRNEEELLQQQLNPEEYNEKVVFPEKVRLNKEYIQSYSFVKDLKYILQTVGILR